MIRSIKSPRKLARTAVIALAVVLSAGVATADGNGSNQIRKITVSQKANQTTVRVSGTSRPTYTAFKLSTPKRLIVDLANSHVKGVPSVVDAKTPLIDGVAISEFSTGGVAVARVMVNFKKEAGYRVKVKGNDLLITLTGGPAPKVSKTESSGAAAKAIAEAKAEAADAKADAKKAREQALSARAEADAAETREQAATSKAKKTEEAWTAAMKQLASMKKLAESREDEAARAKRDAADAVAVLDKARAQLAISESSGRRKLAKAEKSAKAKVDRLQKEIESANTRAAKEQRERKSLEQRLVSLREELDDARRSVAAANSIKDAAVASAQGLKQDARESTINAGAARDETKRALKAQKVASDEYQESAQSEKTKLLAVLKQRERETVEAKRRLASAEADRGKIETKLSVALSDLSEATTRARKAAQKEKRVEAKANKGLARAEKRRVDAEKSVAKAEKRAAAALVAKRAAEAEMDRVRTLAREKSTGTEKAATRKVADAQQRVREARKVQKEAVARTESFRSQVAKAEKKVAYAQKAAKAAKKEIQIARKRAMDAEKKAATVKKELAKAKSRIKGQEAKYAKAEVKLEKAEDRIARQKDRISALESDESKGAGGNRKLTQEEKRKIRLAEMHEKKSAAEPVKAVAQKESGEAGSKITNIEFVNRGGVQKVVITSNTPVSYERKGDGQKHASLVFEGAGLGPMLERTLDVSDFGGAVESISSYRDGDNVRIDVDCANVAKNSISSDGKTVEWTFAQNTAGQKVAPLGSRSRTVVREDDSAYEYSMDRTAAYSVNLKKYGTKKKKYTGRRIDLDFKDADIHNILRLLSDVGHINIVTADDVSGTVTIRMRNVPWDHALDVILQAKKLGMVRTGNLIRVAPLATLEKEREMEIARRRQNKALEPLETRLIPVSYAQASELQPRAVDLMSDRGKLSVDSRTNVIIARDTVSNLDQIEALIRNLDTQTPQVLIEGRIVEASSTYAREIGIQWGGDFAASTATANPTGLAFPSTVGVAGGATDNQAPVGGLSPVAGGRPNPNFAVNLPAAAGTGSGGALGITLGSIANNANLNLRLSAMEEEGTLRILSSPKILTLDNREAHIEQGTMIPYSRISAQGIQTAFKEAKLNLTVTPHVTADGSVLMNIKMTRDEPDFNNKGARGDPTILKREAETELLVADGHTAVIGGIFTRNHGTSYKKVPFFGDIPILGWLFKNRSDSDRRSEMLIFITPRIVNRAESIGQ